MLPKVYESSPVAYRAYSANEQAVYNLYLREAPRIYDEAVARVLALWAIRERTLHSEVKVAALLSMDVVFWPGWQAVVVYWDGGSGDVIADRKVLNTARSGSRLGLTTSSVAVGRLGELWFTWAGTEIRSFSLPEFEWTGVSYRFDDFDPLILEPWAIDAVEDLLVCGGTGYDLNVYALSTGTQVRVIPLGSRVRDLFLEDTHRLYAVTRDGLLILVDYVRGEVLSVTRLQLIDEHATLKKKFAWEPFTRRILTLEPAADAEDGASTTKVRGYVMRPQPVGLTPPLPLRAPRQGRHVPAVSRLYGDAGEPIAYRTVEAAIDGDASLLTTAVSTDARGYARLGVMCDDAGEATITVETET